MISPWSQRRALGTLALDLLTSWATNSSSIESLVKEAVKVGEGVEGLVEEVRERHDGELSGDVTEKVKV